MSFSTQREQLSLIRFQMECVFAKINSQCTSAGICGSRPRFFRYTKCYCTINQTLEDKYDQLKSQYEAILVASMNDVITALNNSEA